MTLHLSELSADIEEFAAADAAPRSRRSIYRSYIKRVLDIMLVVLSVPIVLPVVLITALLVARDGYSPFYSQMRIGKNGRQFRIWKLRTMINNADAHLETYLAENPEARREWDETQKLKNDPRITRIGRILRKTSLDELPQLWNVLMGSMSLVGPRPMMVDQQKYYRGQSYYNLRPGITGFWQVSDRNNCNFVDRVQYDDEYEKAVSLGTDLQTLRRTVGVVFRGTGY